MFQLDAHQKEFMDTFGYLHFPGLLDDRIDEITEAFDGLLKKNGGDDHEGLERLAVVPFINHDPYLCTLLDDPRIHGIAAGLLGDQYQYWNSDGNLYVGDTRWHSDTQWPEPIRFYKMAIYLDPMTKDTGALRVIPGSHRFGEGYAETVHAHLTGKKGGWGGLHGSDVPAVAVETRPGDLAVFNHSTKHSAWGGGKRRRMFTIVYTGHHTDGPSLEAFRKIIRQHGYTTREVFGREDGPLLSTATPERLRHLQNLITHIPKAA